jgi:hypothetical protein
MRYILDLPELRGALSFGFKFHIKREVINWLKENNIQANIGEKYYPGTISEIECRQYLVFKKEEDAVLCKLVWC